MGSWLVDNLVAVGHDVVSAYNLLGGRKENINPDCEFVKADLTRRQEVSPLIKGVDLIFHIAAYAAEGQSIFSPISINEINLIPMNNLLVEAVNNNIQRFIFTSSMAVYGQQKPPFNERLPRNPRTPMGLRKLTVNQCWKSSAGFTISNMSFCAPTTSTVRDRTLQIPTETF